LYDYSLKVRHIITYVNGKIVSETDSEYIEIEKHYWFKHNKVVSFKEEVQSSAVKCILLERTYLKKRSEKT
jgi:hypothetical protein